MFQFLFHLSWWWRTDVWPRRDYHQHRADRRRMVAWLLSRKSWHIPRKLCRIAVKRIAKHLLEINLAFYTFCSCYSFSSLRKTSFEISYSIVSWYEMRTLVNNFFLFLEKLIRIRDNSFFLHSSISMMFCWPKVHSRQRMKRILNVIKFLLFVVSRSVAVVISNTFLLIKTRNPYFIVL